LDLPPTAIPTFFFSSFCSINVVLTCWCCRGDPFLMNSSNCVYRSRNFSRRLVLCQRTQSWHYSLIMIWFGDSDILRI
jgi:hypothetical protein